MTGAGVAGEGMTGDIAPHRMGEPSPLIFHLSVALSAYGQALMMAPRADSPSFPWTPGLAPERGALAGLDQTEIAAEIAARLRATLTGIAVWQAHPYRRTLGEAPAIWADGCTRLRDFGALPEAARPDGPPILVVPSLINRPYILDLVRGRSLLRWLAGQGFRPLLVDWGEPGPGEAGFDLDSYGARRLVPALAAAREIAGGPVPVIGYCMGGTLSVGLAARVPEDVAALVAIGAPWDFSANVGIAGAMRSLFRSRGAQRAELLLESMGEAFGLVPVTFLQTLFALVNPMQAAMKFQKLARLDPAGPAAELFVALEDWLADGVPMPAAAARDLLVGWQIRNLTAADSWCFLGERVVPSAIRVPALVVCGESDSIAPPSLARPLAAVLPQAAVRVARTGHVGMIVGSEARAAVWRPLADFLWNHCS
ncbi:MAG: alpha/beta fold hydrolase [Amaricoccus sp.]|uniref:alpha/beta fold hydrolase n=1 Tax=Amaricoccus sp. TaxID=1872485 RepID=UPI0039E31367